jgi:hypothetical protein
VPWSPKRLRERAGTFAALLGVVALDCGVTMGCLRLGPTETISQWRPPLDDEITLRLSRRQIMTIGAALARHLDYWEEHAAADGHETHPAEQLEDIRQQIGELIWDLEVAAGPPGARLEHSQRARRPRSRE